MEVCYNGTYRPVCDEDWTYSEAAVVCYNMGYSSPYYRKYLDLILISKEICHLILTFILTAGPEATRGTVFGLSDETPVLQDLMCNGTEYSLSSCPGYDLNNVTGDYCLSGMYQAGVRCIEGTHRVLT